MDDLGSFLIAMAFVVIIVMVVLWVPYSLFNVIRPRRRQSANDILKARYARGEISEQEYRKKRAELDE